MTPASTSACATLQWLPLELASHECQQSAPHPHPQPLPCCPPPLARCRHRRHSIAWSGHRHCPTSASWTVPPRPLRCLAMLSRRRTTSAGPAGVKCTCLPWQRAPWATSVLLLQEAERARAQSPCPTSPAEAAPAVQLPCPQQARRMGLLQRGFQSHFVGLVRDPSAVRSMGAAVGRGRMNSSSTRLMTWRRK
jgi:hypothetical protein